MYVHFASVISSCLLFSLRKTHQTRRILSCRSPIPSLGLIYLSIGFSCLYLKKKQKTSLPIHLFLTPLSKPPRKWSSHSSSSPPSLALYPSLLRFPPRKRRRSPLVRTKTLFRKSPISRADSCCLLISRILVLIRCLRRWKAVSVSPVDFHLIILDCFFFFFLSLPFFPPGLNTLRTELCSWSHSYLVVQGGQPGVHPGYQGTVSPGNL